MKLHRPNPSRQRNAKQMRRARRRLYPPRRSGECLIGTRTNQQRRSSPLPQLPRLRRTNARLQSVKKVDNLPRYQSHRRLLRFSRKSRTSQCHHHSPQPVPKPAPAQSPTLSLRPTQQRPTLRAPYSVAPSRHLISQPRMVTFSVIFLILVQLRTAAPMQMLRARLIANRRRARKPRKAMSRA